MAGRQQGRRAGRGLASPESAAWVEQWHRRTRQLDLVQFLTGGTEQGPHPQQPVGCLHQACTRRARGQVQALLAAARLAQASRGTRGMKEKAGPPRRDASRGRPCRGYHDSPPDAGLAVGHQVLRAQGVRAGWQGSSSPLVNWPRPSLAPGHDSAIRHDSGTSIARWRPLCSRGGDLGPW